MSRIKLLCNVWLWACFKVLINRLFIFIRRSSVRSRIFFARILLVVVEGRSDKSGCLPSMSVFTIYKAVWILGSHTSSAISFLNRIFLALKNSSNGCCSSLSNSQQQTFSFLGGKEKNLPIDITKLVLSHTTFKSHRDIERSTSRNSPSDTRHGNERNILDLYVGCWFRNEYQTLVQKV